ncbi:site-2 protease family protein [bacterium]|nr:site-2 protease family protein [bacterium]
MLIQILFRNPLLFFTIAIPLLYSIVLHELAHALCASWFGDHTAKARGRITLNPLKHLDPVGTILLFTFGFGWAKPVPINTANFKPKKIGIICCSLAGVTANFLIAFICYLLVRLVMLYSSSDNSILFNALIVTGDINIILAAFNILPIPPLDGSRILAVLLPKRFQIMLYSIEKFGIVILMALLYFRLLDPLITFIRTKLLMFIIITSKLITDHFISN